MEGYIKLYRKVFENPLFQLSKREKATWLHAWMDLIRMANWKENEIRVNNSFVKVKRGEVVTTISYLRENWNWDWKTVKAFLLAIETADMTENVITRNYTLIKIKNYDKYQSDGEPNGERHGENRENVGRTDYQLQKNSNKEGKRKVNKSTPPTPPFAEAKRGVQNNSDEWADRRREKTYKRNQRKQASADMVRRLVKSAQASRGGETNEKD